ncbi:NADH:ubiquinone reductase (Na(+)-transporting) subunit F [Millionella massiliensis]|uniref:NADH:ubiquinone reductase (Na(+)-transporting) subunit F n=1 Tax=Millionella massiliensis TaxID=1871023 RepID=UPI0008DB1A3B
MISSTILSAAAANLTPTLVAAIIAFVVITLILVAVLLFAKKKLTPSGNVTITINGEKEITAPTGSSLLSTLSEQGIYLPSACGGGGSCGMCKCQVLEGGGEILPTEVNFFSRKQQQDHWRLGCQVKVKNDLKIQVPESVLGVKKWECEVISNRNISTFLKEFVVKLPEGEQLKFRSGGYIQIDVPKYDEIKFSDMDVDEQYRADWDKFKMWDLVTKNPEPTFRAYSMANHPAEGNIIMLNIRIATPPFDKVNGGFMKVNPGICSSYIFSRKPGDKVTISGPYGEFFLPDNLPDTQELIFIGGGAGMAPMRSHIMHLFKTEKTKRPVSFWYGARALKEAPYIHEFHEIEEQFPNFSFHLALDRPDPDADAAGVPYKAGFVHNVLYENYLKNHEDPEGCIYLMCGPPMMISSVVKMLDSLGVPPENILYDNFGS